MRCLWLVAIFLAAPFYAGCKAQSPSTLNADQALPNCKLADDADARMAIEVAEKYFIHAVGVEVSSMKVEAVSVCKKRLVVPIEAVTVGAETARVWFVEIDRNSSENISLIRPE